MKFILLLTCLYSSIAFAQDSTFAAKYESKTLYLYGNNNYVLTGEKLSAKQLAEELKKYQMTSELYLLSERKNGAGGLLFLGTIGCYIAAFSQMEKNKELAWAFGIAGFTANIVAIPFFNKGQKHLQKAVWLYNKEALY